MAERMEQEWQPGIYRIVHNRVSDADLTKLGYVCIGPAERDVRIRPYHASPEEVLIFRSVGCDSEKFWELDIGDICCEHEILTD